MGRTAVHTQEQVFDAANKLAANHQEVTPNTLRDMLGRGSYSTFVRHIDAWHQARKTAPVEVILDMPDSVKSAFANCWQAAASEAGKEIATIREKADAEINGTKRRLDEAIATIDMLESEAESDATRLDVAESALAAERVALQKVAADAATREAGLSATVDQMREQIKAQQVELARLHVEVEATRNQQIESINRLTTDFSGRLAAAASKLDASHASEREFIKEAAAAKAEAMRLADQLKEQKARSIEVIGKQDKIKQVLEGELAAIRKEARELSANLATAQGEVQALRAQVTGQTDVIKGFAASTRGDKNSG